ncbi:MAG: holo-ACP synthase [Clostridia bacterium]
MIVGIGCDIIKISRMEKNVLNSKFLEKIFTKDEIDYINKKSNKAETAAGIFSAKEATSKAIGTGFIGFNFIDVEVMYDKSGAPYVKISDSLKAIIKSDYKFHLSISHDTDYAIAYVVCEK